MKKLGYALFAAGILILLVSFGMDTAPEGTHNIGLLQQQLMVFQLGALLAIVGALATVAGIGFTRLENAGILPPAGHKAPSIHGKE